MEKEMKISNVIENLKEMAALYDEIVQELLSDIDSLILENASLNNRIQQIAKEKDIVENELNDKKNTIDEKIKEIATLKQPKNQKESLNIGDIMGLLQQIKEMLEDTDTTYDENEELEQNGKVNKNTDYEQSRSQQTPKYSD